MQDPGPDFDQQVLRLLRDGVERIPQLEERRARRSRGGPQARSQLGRDDQALDPLAISTQVQVALTMATDYLGGFVDLVGNDPREVRLRIVAVYPLLRAALECSATALWLLAPDQPRERQRRSLCLYLRDHEQDEVLLTAMHEASAPGAPSPDNTEATTFNAALIRGLGEGLGFSHSTYRQAPGYRRIVEEAGESAGIGGAAARFTWLLASGLAHPQQSRLMAVSTLELVAREGALDTQIVTANPITVVHVLNSAIALFDAAEEMYGVRAMTPAAG